eukprot:jgi/Psemu1/291124/fgenesh1_pg.629_\
MPSSPHDITKGRNVLQVSNSAADGNRAGESEVSLGSPSDFSLDDSLPRYIADAIGSPQLSSSHESYSYGAMTIISSRHLEASLPPTPGPAQSLFARPSHHQSRDDLVYSISTTSSQTCIIEGVSLIGNDAESPSAPIVPTNKSEISFFPLSEQSGHIVSTRSTVGCAFEAVSNVDNGREVSQISTGASTVLDQSQPDSPLSRNGSASEPRFEDGAFQRVGAALVDISSNDAHGIKDEELEQRHAQDAMHNEENPPSKMEKTIAILSSAATGLIFALGPLVVAVTAAAIFHQEKKKGRRKHK